MQKLIAFLTLLLLAVLCLGLVVINNEVLGDYRIDLTEDQVYSLSEGSQRVLNDIDEPIAISKDTTAARSTHTYSNKNDGC